MKKPSLDGMDCLRFIQSCLDRLGRGDSVRQIEEEMKDYKTEKEDSDGE